MAIVLPEWQSIKTLMQPSNVIHEIYAWTILTVTTGVSFTYTNSVLGQCIQLPDTDTSSYSVSMYIWC